MLELRWAVRGLLKTPVFTTIAVLSLAVGIGASTAAFSVVKAVLLDPLPYPNATQLVGFNIHAKAEDRDTKWASCAAEEDWARDSRSFDGIGTYRFSLMNETGSGLPQAVYGLRMSPSLLPMIGTKPQLGRWFTADEARVGNEHEVLLSDDMWRRDFRRDANVLGRTVTLDRESYAVVGVMPPHFNFPPVLEVGVRLPTTQMQYWAPLALDPKRPRTAGSCIAVARLKPGISIAGAQAEVDAKVHELAQRYPKTDAGYDVRITSLQQQVEGGVGRSIWFVFGAVMLVLLVACSNVAGLMLARSESRRTELVVRMALGASIARLAWHGLMEGLVLAAGGAAAGVSLAYGVLQALPALAAQRIARLDSVHVDLGVLVFGAMAALICAVVCGLAPVLHFRSANVQLAMRANSRTATAKTTLRRALVIAQVSIAVVLSVCAGLLVKSFERLRAVDPGFRPDHVLASVVVLPQTDAYETADQRKLFWNRALEEVRHIPGVITAAASRDLPLSGQDTGAFVKVADHPVEAGREPIFGAHVISPDYFAAVRTPLLDGRGFTEADGSNSPLVAIVSDSVARRLWPGESPIGKRISIEPPDVAPVWREVVGMVAGARQEALEVAPMPEVFTPMEQSSAVMNFLLVRTAGRPELWGRAVRAAVANVDPNQPVFLQAPFEDWLNDTLGRRRFSTAMVLAFGVIALALAAAGLYAIIAFLVAQSTRDIGVRIALGARRLHILQLITGTAVGLAGAGVVAGIAMAIFATRFIQAMLFEVKPLDATVLVGVCAGVLMIALLSATWPAAKAMRINPIEALRSE